jgi:ketosteroid isomerase-like protein
MSQQNVELVEKWLASFTTDRDAFRNTLHREIEWFPFEDNHTPSYGLDGAMRIRDGWLDAWDEMRADLEQIVEEGDAVVASIHVTGTGKGSGVEVDVRLHLLFKVREQKIVYLFEHTDRTEALEAAELSEQDAHAEQKEI